MNIPGFTADASLYRSASYYSTTFSQTAAKDGTVVPSFFSPCAMICAVCVASLTANPLLDPIDIFACGQCMACAGIV
jgi:hypothetical protein